MAMIDYGAIAWKDGKLISTDMFTDMIDMVGWDDNGEQELSGNYFAYIGDEDLTLGFYKSTMRIYRKDYPYRAPDSENGTVFFGIENFKGWKYWHDWFLVNKDTVDIKVYPRKFHNYYICKMTYREHKYKVAFGYGVDLGYYERTHIIDYYGTPWFRLKDWWKYTVKEKIRDIKYDIDWYIKENKNV